MKKRVKEIGIALSTDELEQLHDMRVLLANIQNTLKKITFVDTSEEIKELSSCMKQLYYIEKRYKEIRMEQETRLVHAKKKPPLPKPRDLTATRCGLI